MPTARIPYATNTAMGAQVAEFVDSVMVALQKGLRLRNQFVAMQSDSAAIEAEIGGMNPDQGNDLWFLLNQSISRLDNDEIKVGLAKLDQGG